MAIEWASLCDLAYFDTYQNLCVIGVQTQAAVATLPAGTQRFAIAARMAGLRRNPSVVVSVSSPDGASSDLAPCERMEVEANGDYMLVRLGRVPLVQEGIYRFEVSVSGQEPFDIPIMVTTHSA